jgi:hypothetical protein
MLSTRYTCQILVKSEFSRQIFEKKVNTKFHQNPLIRRRVIAREQTDRREKHYETNSLFPQFSKAPKTRFELFLYKFCVHKLITRKC